jgi:hypothetical protein
MLIISSLLFYLPTLLLMITGDEFFTSEWGGLAMAALPVRSCQGKLGSTRASQYCYIVSDRAHGVTARSSTSR